ncbi:MAG: glycoside hydrolase domain-containing protein [Bacteroidales bacterium]
MKKTSFWLLTLLCSLSLVVVAQSAVELSVPVANDPAWAKTPKGLQLAWTSTDYNNEKYQYPTRIEKANLQKMTAWKGERITAKLFVWSSQDEGELQFSVNQPQGTNWLDEATTGFMTYVMTDELDKNKKGGCAPRPDRTLFDSSLVVDQITSLRSIQHESKTVRPIWITFDIPRNATAGNYSGSIEVKSTQSTQVKTLQYSIQVINQSLPEPNKGKFHLDLWQNPFAVARIDSLTLWSKEHFDAMRPIMERLAKAGQKGITATITHKPWNAQTYDPFENMITEIRTIDGKWIYDYTLFDRWVEFMQSCGVGPYIYCYSVIPWKLSFSYYDQAVNSMVSKTMGVDSAEFDEYWVSKLSAFALHLKAKGWFNNTIIAMDERPKESMDAALRVIRKSDPQFKISLAGNYHKELDDELFDLCIPYKSKYPEGVVEMRKQKGKITTFYTCCAEDYPNTFTFSQPIEATAYGLVAQERGLDGYLRWAYNHWVEAPAQDSRFKTWSAGDTYIVYPNNNSSARFEKLIEGIQIFEKIEVLKQKSEHKQALKKLLQPFAQGKLTGKNLQEDIKKVKAYLNKFSK